MATTRLALGTAAHALDGLLLVAPDDREGEFRAQLRRPAFQALHGAAVSLMDSR